MGELALRVDVRDSLRGLILDSLKGDDSLRESLKGLE